LIILSVDVAGGVSVSMRVDDMNVIDEFLRVLILRLFIVAYNDAWFGIQVLKLQRNMLILASERRYYQRMASVKR